VKGSSHECYLSRAYGTRTLSKRRFPAVNLRALPPVNWRATLTCPSGAIPGFTIRYRARRIGWQESISNHISATSLATEKAANRDPDSDF